MWLAPDAKAFVCKALGCCPVSLHKYGYHWWLRRGMRGLQFRPEKDHSMQLRAFSRARRRARAFSGTSPASAPLAPAPRGSSAVAGATGAAAGGQPM